MLIRNLVLQAIVALGSVAYASGNNNQNNSDTNYNTGDTIENSSKSVQGAISGSLSNVNSSNSQNTTSKSSVGDTTSKSDQVVGDTTSKSNQVVGDSKSSQQTGSINSSLYIAGDNLPEIASSTAAVLSQQCQEGMSGQGITGGLSAVFDSAQCVYLRQAQAHLNMAAFYSERGMDQTAQLEVDRAISFLKDADTAVKYQTPPKAVGGALVSLLPIAALFLLF